ncbi:hypothetical protein ACJRO7_010968, partial [Eucalyptus globulus]
GDKDYRLIKERFIARLAALGVQVTLVAIHKNCFSSTMQIKGGDNTANMKSAWYATSKEEVLKILSYEFGFSGKTENHGFVPACQVMALQVSSPRKLELISPSSKQSHPGLEEYDWGVDDVSSPRRYIICTHMNIHMSPKYIVNFKASCCLRDVTKFNFPLHTISDNDLELLKILPPSHV